MGNKIIQKAEFSCISKEDGELLSDRMIQLNYPDFKEHVTVLQQEAQTLDDGGVLAYATLKTYKFDKYVGYQRRDALVYICKKEKKDKMYTCFIYNCLNYSLDMDISSLRELLESKGAAESDIVKVFKVLQPNKPKLG